MTIADLIKAEIDNIPEEAQLLLLDFIELLKKHYSPLNIDNIDSEIIENIGDESFIGMWKDRDEMKDSSKWVRQIRQQEWK